MKNSFLTGFVCGIGFCALVLLVSCGLAYLNMSWFHCAINIAGKVHFWHVSR